VLTQAEVALLFRAMDGPYRLMARLLYGSGLRLCECMNLRVKNLDLTRNQILVRTARPTLFQCSAERSWIGADDVHAS